MFIRVNSWLRVFLVAAKDCAMLSVAVVNDSRGIGILDIALFAVFLAVTVELEAN